MALLLTNDFWIHASEATPPCGTSIQAGPTLPQATQSHSLQHDMRLITWALYDRGDQEDRTAPVCSPSI